MRLRVLVFVLAVLAAIALIGRFAMPVRAPGTSDAGGAPSLEAAIREIDAGRQTAPLIGEQPRRGRPSVTFLATRDGGDVPRIVSDATGWGERPDGTFDYSAGRMTPVGRTGWYSLETKVEPYARIEYLIAYGAGDYRLDPHNPRKVQRANGPASEFVMPGYMPPQEFVDPPMRPAGTVVDTVVESRILKSTRRVIVYTPPGYQRGVAYPLAVFHDGAMVVNTGEAPRVLDWLIAHRAIEPIVAVFVDPQSRVADDRRGAPMRAFVTGELLPWIAAHYSVTTDPGERAIIGISASARGAVDAAASLESFGRLGLLIPALDPGDVTAVKPRGPRTLRASIVAATYDTLNLGAARAAQLELIDKGHDVDFVEVPEGHSTVTWRTHLRTVLISLFGSVRPSPPAARSPRTAGPLRTGNYPPENPV